MKIREFVDRDLPSLVALFNETYKGSYEFIPFDETALRSWIRERNPRIFIAEEDNKVKGFVVYRSGHWGDEIRWLCVSDHPNRKLVEDALVREVEKLVKRGEISTTVDAEDSKIEEWIKRGYKPEGGLYHMVAQLDGLKPIPKVPEGIKLRSLKPNEEKELVEAINNGFGWERVTQDTIRRWKKNNPPFDEEWVHVAELDGRIISVVVSKPDTEYNRFFKGRRGYLGPAATLPEHRNKNLAKALTRRAMNFLYEKKMNSVALYTSERNVPSVTLLRKLGFKVKHHWKFLHKDLK